MTGTAVAAPKSGVRPRKPLMTWRQILLMNIGFFGIQYSFGMQNTAVNPIFLKIGADPHDLPIMNLAGPVCGLVLQPLIGAMSDRTWHPRWGRRKAYFLIGAIGCSICLFLFPLASALWMAVVLLWLLDASNNTAMEPFRAFLADKLDDSQLAKGFLTQSFFTGGGVALANFCVFLFQKWLSTGEFLGVPYWVLTAFWLGAICSITTVLITVISTPEDPPTPEELEELQARKAQGGGAIREIAGAVKDMPATLHKLGLVYMFQWYALVVYWQFIALTLAKGIFGTTDPHSPEFEKGAGMVGFANGTYTLVTVATAFLLVGLARKYGAKWVHTGALVLAAGAMWMLPSVTSQWGLLIPMILLGIAWASCMGVPYIMVVSVIPKERYGVYMGIINMMIVVPMIIQGFTFGWIYEHLLHNDPFNAMKFSAALFVLGAIAMTWIRPPKKQSPIIPLTYRTMMEYDRVLVGSDGSVSSIHAVEKAAELAQASEAGLIVACAYNPVSARDSVIVATNVGEARPDQVRGRDHAQNALELSTQHLNTSRLKHLDKVVVEGDPADAIVELAAGRGVDLIVIGNRGVGAVEGALLGSVPMEVARKAPCDVLVVQTQVVTEAEQILDSTSGG